MLRRPDRMFASPGGDGGSTREWRENYYPGTLRARGDGSHALGFIDALQTPWYRGVRSLYEDNTWYEDGT